MGMAEGFNGNPKRRPIKVDYTVLIMSDLNTKLKLLEEEKQSLITALNILQVNEFKSNTQNPGQYVLANIQNEKSQPEQLEISSDSEYNIPLANRYSTLADEGKLNEDESEQTTQQQGQASVITMELNVQQQQQQSTCNQSSEQCNSDVRVDNQQGQLRVPASNEPPHNGNSKKAPSKQKWQRRNVAFDLVTLGTVSIKVPVNLIAIMKWEVKVRVHLLLETQ